MTESRMSCDVEKRRRFALLNECRTRSLCVVQNPRLGEDPIQPGDLISDERRVLVRYSDKQRRLAGDLYLFKAIFHDRGARCVGQLVLVHEVLLPVIKGMERQEVQGPVRHNHDMWRADFPDEGLYQPLIELPQPEPGRFEKL